MEMEAVDDGMGTSVDTDRAPEDRQQKPYESTVFLLPALRGPGV